MTKLESSANSPNSLVNLRDLAELPTEHGALTRQGVVYRSDAPYSGDSVPEITSHWPPRAVVDLRDGHELNGWGHPLADSVTVHHIPLLEELRDSSVWLPLEELYLYMLTDVPKKLVDVFRIALDTDGPVLIHCAAGKDRTGVASAMLLSAVGVRYDSIVADYVHTDRNMLHVLRRLGEEPELPPGVDEEAVRKLISTPSTAIEGVLAHFAAYEGGAAGWLMAHGVTPTELTRWREKFVAEPV